MSLVLNQVVQAQCPGCGNTLRIPANWIAEPMKCKHCGLVFQAKPPKKKKNLLKNAIKGATRLAGKMKIKRRRKKKKDKGAVTPAMSRPVAPPPGVPVAAPALPGGQAAVPVAKVAGNGAITPAPVAMPVGPGGRMVPTAAPVAMGLANGQKPPSFRRRRGSWAKLAFIFIFLLGVGSLAAVVHHLNPGLFNQGDDEEVADNSGDTKPAADTKPADTKPTESKGLFKTNTAPKKTESTKILFNTAPVTRATQPKMTFPTKPPIETRPVGTKPITTRPIETRPIDRPDTRDTRVSVPVVDAGKGYPRSLLAISINNYPYANPVGYGSAGKSFDNIARQFAEVMRIPQDRVTILSDRAPVPLPPTKSLVIDAFEQFLSTKASRPMDHVVVLFVGHGVEINGNAYLVPLLGEPGDEKTLIPLDWVYSRLAASPAQEKLLILDTCRFDKQRGEERGAVAKMSEAFEAALQKPPKGVEVITACSANEYSWEVENNQALNIDGGVFLNSIAIIKGEGGLRGVEHKPDGPLPVEELFKAMRLRTSPKVGAYLKEKQTPQYFGARADKMVAFDPKATVPGKITLKLNDADFPGGIAGANDLAGILNLPNRVPPIKQGDKGNQLRADSLPPYPKTPLAAYKADNKDSDFRAAVQGGVDLLVKHNNAFQETFPPLPANQQQKTQFFNQLTNQQMTLALVYNDLESKYEELKLLTDDRKGESKLWQANYDYVMARIQFRMAYFYEYNAMLGKIRKEELPTLDPQVHKGYKLASKASMSDRDAQKIADNAKKILKKVAEDHKGTPWELIAKKEMFTSLGLEWVAY